MARECYFGVGKSNCLTYIPEDIKLELNNGTLTLKAGSKVYVPNGFTGESTETTVTKTDWYCFSDEYMYLYLNHEVPIVGETPYCNKDNSTKPVSSASELNTITSKVVSNTDGKLGIDIYGTTYYLPRYPEGDLTTTITEVIPSGTPKFDEVVISKDYTFSTAWNDKRMLFIRHNSDTDRYIDAYPVGQCHSGSTPPTGSQWMFWYDTSSNILKRTSDSGTTWDNYYSFPICIYNSDNGGITSIDQTFNGFGYIGSHYFITPKVKALLPNGLNSDGTYKSVEFEVPRVLIASLSSTWSRTLVLTNQNEGQGTTGGGVYYYEQNYAPTINSSNYERWYNPAENKMYYHANNETSWKEYDYQIAAVGTGVSSDGKITSLTPRAVQTQNTALKVNEVYFGVGKSNCLTYIPEDIKLELDEVITDWTQPALTSNGTMDGNAFACSESSFYTETDGREQRAWRLFASGDYDGNNEWQVNSVSTSSTYSVAWYNPKPLKISALEIQNGAGTYSPTKVVLQACNDKVSWVDLGTTNNSNTTTSSWWNATISSTGWYKYYRIVCTPRNTMSIMVARLKITAQEKSKTLTLKAGSKVYVPNGFEEDGTTPKFDEVVIENDVFTQGPGGTASNYPLAYGINRAWSSYTGIDCFSAGNIYSGNTKPTVSDGNHLWYDTANNIIMTTSNGGSTWIESRVGLPFCIVSSTSGAISSIDQIFNGFGYIGSSVYLLPGVKGLIANGINPHGTYKSIQTTSKSVSVWTSDITYDIYLGILSNGEISICGQPDYSYDSIRNIAYNIDDVWQAVIGCSFSCVDGKITSLTPREIQYNNQIIEVKRVYKGSQLIWGYNPSEVIFQSSTAGTYTVDIATSGYYNVAVVGAGSGGAYVYSSKFSDGRASGGSGAAFVGVVYLSSGNHTIKVGAGGAGKAYESNGQSSATSTAGGQSSIDSIIVAGGGGAAYAGIHGATQTAGSGGTLSYDSSKVQSYSLATNGNSGTTIYNSNITGGASVYGGYGKGGNAGNSYTTSGSNGYVLISAV